MRVCLVDGGDRSDWVSFPRRPIQHCILLRFVIPVLLCYLLHLDTKPNSHEAMIVILAHPVPCCDVCSRSNARNWTSRDEMPCAATFPAVSSRRGCRSGRGRGQGRGKRRSRRSRPDCLRFTRSVSPVCLDRYCRRLGGGHVDNDGTGEAIVDRGRGYACRSRCRGRRWR